jgi:hypothetical protein
MGVGMQELTVDQVLKALDQEILRHNTLCNRGHNNLRELDVLQNFRLKTFNAKLEVPKVEKPEGCQRVIF